MPDNEHTLAPLRHTEVLSVKAGEGPAIAEFPQPGGEAVKIVGLINFLKAAKLSRCFCVKAKGSGKVDSSSSSFAAFIGLRIFRDI